MGSSAFRHFVPLNYVLWLPAAAPSYGA